VYWDIVEVKPRKKYELLVRFADGLSGVIRFKPEFFSGVFKVLRDMNIFNQVFIDNGAVAWPGDIDLAPDAMYKEIKAHGEWVLS